MIVPSVCEDVSNEIARGADMHFVGLETPAMQSEHVVTTEAEGRE